VSVTFSLDLPSRLPPEPEFSAPPVTTILTGDERRHLELIAALHQVERTVADLDLTVEPALPMPVTAGPDPALIAALLRDTLTEALTQQTTLTTEALGAIVDRLKTLSRQVVASSSGGAGGGSSSVRITNDASNPVPVTMAAGSGGLTNTELRATKVPVKDAYASGEVLADQVGAGAVLTFTFSSAIDFIWVNDIGATTTNISRCDPFGGTPSASLGVAVPNAVPTPIFVTPASTTVKVFAPSGSTISLYGHRL